MSGVERVLSAELVHLPVGSHRIINGKEGEQGYGNALKDQACDNDTVADVWRLALVGLRSSEASSGGLQQDGDDVARDKNAWVRFWLEPGGGWTEGFNDT